MGYVFRQFMVATLVIWCIVVACPLAVDAAATVDGFVGVPWGASNKSRRRWPNGASHW
jgi:hypothetical protein